MFTVQLTSYGQTLVSSLVNIDGIILLYDTIADISSVTSTSSYTVQLDEEACGNLNKNIGNVKVQDSRSNEYIAKTILFYVLNGSEKKIVAGYSQGAALVQKSSSPLTVFLSFDFSVFTNGFLFSSIQAGYGNAAHNTDGIVHIENPDISTDDTFSVYNKPQIDALLQDKQDSLTAGEGIAITDDTVKTTGIPFGICDNTSTATAFTVTVPGIYKLEDGVCCLVKNGVITSASGFTLNVNGLGGKPVYSNMAAATRETTIFNVNYTMLFVYDSTRVDGGCWVCYRGYYSDANSIAYQIRGNVHTLPTTAKFYRYRLLFTSADGTHFVPSNTSTSTNATALRDVNQTPIDPFGEIVYYSTTAAVDASALPGPTYLWTQYAVTLGYSFNRTGAALVLDSFKPLYIKCAPQSDGSAIIDATTPYVQTLPSTADGKIYIFLGITSSATSVELLNNHPIYYHDGTGIRLWHGKDSYSKSEIDTIVGDYVPTSRTVNNKPLSSDITLTLDDIADGTNRVIPTVNDSTITIKKNASDTGDSFTTNTSSGKTINLGLSTVATSGSYNDLSNTPTIPTVNDAKLTIKKNSSDTGTEFTANASSDVTCNLNLAAVASSGSYSDLSNTPSIPTDTSDLTNGAGFISTETDPTVPSWAKEQSKPTYTLDEVTDGSTRKLSDYVPTSRKVNNKTLTSDITLTLDDVADGTNRSIPTVNNATLTIQKNGTTVNTFTANASSNVTANITVPTTVAELTDSSNYAQTSSLSSLVATAQYNSTDKTIEFYNASGTKLNTDIDATAFIKDGIVDDVEITGGNLVISFNTDAGKEDIEIPISDIFDANNYYTKTQVDNLIPTVNNATLTIQKNGTTVNTFTANASSPVTANITVPTTVAELSDSSNYVTTNDLATVATSGDYDDLINKPTLPTVNNATLTIKKTASDTGTTFTANASTDVTCNLDLATVATSGSYNDLSNTPTIPTVNNATLTIQRNGTTVDTFTANASSDVTVNITVPTNTNQLTNGAGFITSTALSTYVEKVDPATENAIVRFRNIKGDLKDSGVLIDDHNNVILPTGRDTANADKNPHIDIGQSWLGNISSRDTVLYVGTLASNTYTTRYAFQQTAFKPMTDDSYSLGFTSFRWKYLYLSNSIKNGSYTYSLPSATGTLALTSDIPTNVSQLTNDSGYLTSYTETDPTVPSWAKEQNKPSYTLDEVSDGTTRKLSDYVPTSRTVNSKALTTDITLTLDDVADGTNRVIPTVNNATLTINKGGTDDTSSKTFSANASSNVTINLGLHSVASSGSYNDLTNKPTIPTTTSQLTNDSGFITSSDLPTNYVTTDTVQTITALKTFIYGIDLGTYHTSASQSLSTQLTVWDDTTNYQGGIEVTGNFNPATEDEYNLGSSNFPWLNVYANSFIKSGGTSAQFLKADGSVDSNTYLTSSDLPTNHVTTDTDQEITGAKTIAENKLKIGSTSSNEDIDNFVFKRGQEFIVGTQSSATSLWKGNTIQDSVYEGMCINYFVPVACTSTAVTLELTLPDGTTTGAIPVRRNAGNTATNTHIGVGSVVQLTLLLNRTVGTTDYEKVWRMNEWYDSNTNTTGYQLRTNSTVMTVTDTARYYKLYFTSADGEHWVPASVNSTNNATTARAVNQRPIDPFGRIVYTSASTNYTAGSNLAATTIWDQYAITLGYSFNVNGGDLTLTTKTPVYVKCAPQTNGSAIIDSTNPTVQDLPTSADGKIYIFLGVAYDATHIELVQNHPVYYHDGNGIKLWTGSTIPSKTSDLTNDSGFITSANIPTNVSQLTNDANYITSADIPTNVSYFTNDAGYLTSFTETDPTVPSWAKASSKPSYTLDEVSDGSIRKLSNYELKTNLKEGAYIDVDETTMTSTSTNLPTSKAVASYISGLNYITSADIPTNHVTTDTVQTISGSKSVTSLVHLVGRHNSATHGGLKFSDSSDSTTFTEIASATSDTVSNQASVFLKFYSNSSYVASIDTTFTDSSSGTHIEVEPSADNICYIGTSTNRLKNVYTHNLGSSTVYTDSAYITDIYTTKSSFTDNNFTSTIEQSGYNFLVYVGGAAGSIRIGSQSQDGITGSIKLTEYELELDCDSSNTYCILPKTASCANLGSSSNPFDYVYANNIDSTSITAMQATIDTVTGYLNGSADTAYALEETTNIDGISYNGSADVNHYAVCSTGAGTKAKKITVPGFVLAEGARVTVKFTASNTASAPTLTVNDGTTDSAAKPICYRGTTAVSNSSNYYRWQANDVVDLVYDGTNWIIIGWQQYAATASSASYATYVGSSSSAYVAYSNNGSAGSRALLPRTDVTTTDWVDLGSAAKRWKTLYLTDSISDGTNTFSLPDKSGTLAVEFGTYVVSSSPLGSSLIQSGKDYRQPEPSGSNFTDNPKWRGKDVSIGISQYVDLSENSRISIYVPYTTYIGSIAFLSAQGASTYSAYPLYFRGDTSAHNATVPGGSILRLTFREDAFYNDFYDLADFGVEHEPIVRVGKLPHQLTAENYNGALVGVRADNGKLDKVLTITKSGTTVTETLTNLHSSSPIYVSFMHECFSAHPRVPFGLVTNMEYIYSAGGTPSYGNMPFIFIENGSIVSSSSDIQSHIVTSSTGKRYFHINNAPVYLSYRSFGPNDVYISIGGPYSGYVGKDGTTLIGFLPSDESEAGLLRLVNCFTPDNYAAEASSASTADFASKAYTLQAGNSASSSTCLCGGTIINSYVSIQPGGGTTNQNNTLDLGNTTNRWRNIYVNGKTTNYYFEIGNDTTNVVAQPVVRPSTNGYGYIGTSSYHLNAAYINNLYLTSDGTSIATYIGNQIADKVSGTGVGSICLLNVSITNSASSVATISRGSLLNSNSNLTVSTLSIASPHLATAGYATPSSYSNTVGCYYSGTASGTSGAYKLLSAVYVPASTTKRYIVLAIRVS